MTTDIPPGLVEVAGEALYMHDCAGKPHFTWTEASTVETDYYRRLARVMLTAVLEGVTVEEELQVSAEATSDDPVNLSFPSSVEEGRRHVKAYEKQGWTDVALRKRLVINLPWALLPEEGPHPEKEETSNGQLPVAG